MVNEAHRDTPRRAEAALARIDPEDAIAALRPYITDARADKIERVLAERTDALAVAVEAPSDPHNAAAIVRTAEALGVLGVHVVAPEGRAEGLPLHRQATTQGAFRWVDTHHHADLGALLQTCRARGMRIAGAAMDGSVPLPRIPVDAPLCLLLGNETRGLSQAARHACDLLFHVPMVGMSESLNLSVTAAIALHNVLSRAPRARLSVAAATRWRARYYARSLDPRLVLGLLSPAASAPSEDPR